MVAAAVVAGSMAATVPVLSEDLLCQLALLSHLVVVLSEVYPVLRRCLQFLVIGNADSLHHRYGLFLGAHLGERCQTRIGQAFRCMTPPLTAIPAAGRAGAPPAP
jgi:hypothetical protein